MRVIPDRFVLALLIALPGCGEDPSSAAPVGADEGASQRPVPSNTPDTSPGQATPAQATPAPASGSGPDIDQDIPREPGQVSGSDSDTQQPPSGTATPAEPIDCSTATLEPDDYELTLDHDGVQREYLVHVPRAYTGDEAVPLVIDMHGLTSSATQQAQISGWRRKADEVGFIVVHPQGLNASWNGGDLCCGSSQANDVDDEGFIRAVVEAMKRDACVDPKRVYATGLSNGGAMSHLLACNAADVFAASAPVSMGNGTRPCQPTRPISVVMTRGTQDSIVSFDGGFLPGALEDLEQWRDLDGCQGEPVASGELCQTYAECDGGVEVTLCAVNAGHVLYSNSQGFSVPDFVWSTFERQRLP